MKKSYTLFFIFIIFCIYSCNNNYTVGPTTTTSNTYDTVFFQSMDSFNIYLNGVFDTVNQNVDTFAERDTTFFLTVHGQKEIVLKYTGITNHPMQSAYIDSSADVKIALGDSTSTLNVPDSETTIFEDLDSAHLSGIRYLDTYRHSRYTFAQCKIRLRINHNHHYNDGDYYIKLNNLRFYKIVLK